MIGITQPRRVAVLATSKRVSYELGLKLGKEVGFQVRHDKKVGSKCSIKFMTDGILLREVQVCACVYFSWLLLSVYFVHSLKFLVVIN
jgi:HrpA-like RNA helicase